MMARACLRSSIRRITVQRARKAAPFASRQFCVQNDFNSTSSTNDLQKQILRQIEADPVFLRDIIKVVRREGKNDPQFVLATELLTDYIQKADVNEDGVLTKHEIKAWLQSRHRNHPEMIENAVRYVADDRSSQSAEPVKLTPTQIRQHLIKISIPFVGFGFLDNVIMIVSGNEIESYFGVSLGISAMAAAGLGNTLSDIVGIQAGGMIEAMSDKLGIEDPELTVEQLKSKTVKMLTVLASMLGITLGCLLGMFPLLFIDDEKDIDKTIRVIFDSIDVDKSGTLEIKELDALFDLLQQGNHIDSREQASTFMRSCGFDEFDSLTFDEFKLLFNAFIQKSMLDKQANEKKSHRPVKA
mmetsp:Transcript_16025/g.26883  ORF Transcript_16025/g.26883 Transcript_16025/m.26883 type:complete len:356 (+) Transcript_16025:83-1150(+)